MFKVALWRRVTSHDFEVGMRITFGRKEPLSLSVDHNNPSSDHFRCVLESNLNQTVGTPHESRVIDITWSAS